MHPNWRNPPQIESIDKNIPLIEQVPGIYWLPYGMQLRHALNLSNWHLAFSGDLLDYEYFIPKYAKNNTNIFDDSNFPPPPEWDKNPTESILKVADLLNKAYVNIGENEFAFVGLVYIYVVVIRLKGQTAKRLGDLSDINNLKSYALESEIACQNLSQIEDLKFSCSMEEIDETRFKQRVWVRAKNGRPISSLSHTLHTALDERHLIRIHYSPDFHYGESKIRTQKAEDISLTPLLDFMDNLTIEEIAAEKTYELGRFEPENREELKLPGTDSDDSFTSPTAW